MKKKCIFEDIRNSMRTFAVLSLVLISGSSMAQALKGIHSKGPTQETIFHVRKESDAAFAINIQSIEPDSCTALSSEKAYVVTGKIIKKYFDKTNKFKGAKITYLTTDTAPYTKEPYHIVFVNKAPENVAEKCKEISWISKPGTAFICTTKTETMIGKKED